MEALAWFWLGLASWPVVELLEFAVRVAWARRQRRLRMVLTFPDGLRVEGEVSMVTLTDVQKVKIGPVTAIDGAGNPAPLPGPPTFTLGGGDPAVLALTDNGDGSASVAAAGPLGTGQVRVDAAGLTATVDFEVIASAAAQLVVAVGTPEAK
jgi:hypothetical protein